ncbi:DnaJ domain protein [Ancylostoma caninum]|uniref:DnaJ domain protein n=1 Tax=Ancylostoma caninum TaxID=29170 RepID=A0A368FNW1_ANCCA|nr:DnaJ domain protein [Ancylostoma caninum]
MRSLLTGVPCYFQLASVYFAVAYASKAEIDKHLELGKSFLAKGQFADALTHYHAAIELDPSNYLTLYRRATVYLAMGKSKQAIPDLDRVVELKGDFTAARIQRGNVLLKQGEIDAAENDFHAVLAVEPSNSEVSGKLDLIADLRQYVHQAKSFYDRDDHHSAEYYLNKALEIENGRVISIRLSGLPLFSAFTLHAIGSGFDIAIEDYQKAQQVNEESRRAREGLEKAQKLKKQAGKRDYYKILGLKRNASKRDITKAYRKMAQKWHPDNFNDAAEKKKAEQKFIDIAAAKEVLSDDEKRAQFDQGIDPLDPEAQQGHTHFHHGFPGGFMFREGGGPFSFKFNF